MGGGDGVEKVYGCVPHGMVAVDVLNWLPEQSRQWKGDSSASMVEPQEHRKGPGAQTSEDAGEGGGGGVIGAYEGTWCIRGGSGWSTGRRKPRPDR